MKTGGTVICKGACRSSNARHQHLHLLRREFPWPISRSTSSKAPLAGTFTAFAPRSSRPGAGTPAKQESPSSSRRTLRGLGLAGQRPVRGRRNLWRRSVASDATKHDRDLISIRPGPDFCLPGPIPLRTLAGGRPSASLSTAGFSLPASCPLLEAARAITDQLRASPDAMQRAGRRLRRRRCSQRSLRRGPIRRPCTSSARRG